MSVPGLEGSNYKNLKEPRETQGRGNRSWGNRENTKRTRPSKTTEQSSYEFTETEAAITKPAQVCARSSVYAMVVQLMWNCA